MHMYVYVTAFLYIDIKTPNHDRILRLVYCQELCIVITSH